MWTASRRIGDSIRNQGVLAQVELVADNQAFRLLSNDIANLAKPPSNRKSFGQDQRLRMRQPRGNTERRGRHVHLSIADHDISEAAEALDTAVLMYIFVIGV